MLGRALSKAVNDEFFRWFHLVRYEAARELADGATWHGFRPDGEKFRELVTVNLETDRAGCIADAKLCLDRAFIEHPKDGPFARDITATFLRWVLPEAPVRSIASISGGTRMRRWILGTSRCG
jgi:hypothetical protein